MLVDLKTDKKFYRNEEAEFFQADCPPELLIAEENMRIEQVTERLP